METAYVDESQIGGTGQGGPYVMVATIVLDGHPGDHRRELERVKPRGEQKLHWYKNVRSVRDQTVEVIRSLPLMHWAVAVEPEGGETPERTRRKCIDRLFWEVAGLEMVSQVWMESRGPADDRRDSKMIDYLKSSHVIPGSMKVDHLRGRDEPLLWVPDAVCGIVGAHLAGDQEWSGKLAHQLWICP